MIDATCVICGKEYRVLPYRATTTKTCSRDCAQHYAAHSPRCREVKLAKRAAGLVKRTTYLKLFGRHEHRVVMERKLGRKLCKGEVVHHIDGNAHNNHPDNLMVTTQSEHARAHSTKNRICSVAGCGAKHAAKGFCNRHYKQQS